MNEFKELAISLVTAIFASGVIQFLITRYDNKKGMEREVKTLAEQHAIDKEEIKKEIQDKVGNLEAKFDKRIVDIDEKMDRTRAEECRTNILRFSDDIKNEVYRSEESFKQIMMDIDTYNDYCDTHKGFKNGLTETASRHITAVYENTFFDDINT